MWRSPDDDWRSNCCVVSAAVTPEVSRIPRSPRVEPPGLDRYALIVFLLVLVLAWGAVRQHITRMDPIFFQLSRTGVLGLARYSTGDYVRAATAYRAHFRTAVIGGHSTGARWTDALLVGDLDRSEALARAELAQKPSSIEARRALGEVALERGELSEAGRWFGEALRHASDDADSLLGRSFVHALSGARDQATQGAVRAHREAQTPVRVVTFLNLLRVTGQLAGASPAIRPDCLLAQYHRYLLALDPSNAGRVVAFAERAIAASDRPADAYLALGVVSAARHQPDAALASFRKATAIDPGHAEAYHQAALVHLAQGDLAEEYRAARAAFDAAPTDLLYLTALDELLTERLGDPYIIVEVMERALQVDPKRALAHERLGYAYGFLRDDFRALDHYRTAIVLQPDRRSLHQELGWVFGRIGRDEEAVAAYRRAVALSPNHPEPHAYLGFQLRTMGRFTEALAEYETALRLGAGPEFHAQLCWVHYSKMDLQRALSCFQAVLQEDPQNPDARHLVREIAFILTGRKD